MSSKHFRDALELAVTLCSNASDSSH